MLKETPAALVQLKGDMLKLAWSLSESAEREKIQTVTVSYYTITDESKPQAMIMYSALTLSHLSDSISQNLDDLVMWCGNYTLSVDFYDTMPNTDASSLCDAASHETADLQQEEKKKYQSCEPKLHLEASSSTK